ncbi:hypothetical protein MKW94_025223 [Papaver nudicaule]|uniref:Uncharacterized protein n=1 Tax=Papaver nudicaule TaxID=74823 RepID=A0AA42AY51_PAPNU|nr:hypothetical protein [Papaver nudicaule]
MYDINKQHPHLTFWCGTAMMTAYAWLVCVNHTYERMLLWFVGFAKRMGLDKVMTRRVLLSVTALMTLVVIEVQSFTALTFLSSMFVSLVSLVVVTYDMMNDTSGFTEGVCICFFASGVVYAWQNVLYHALACFCVSGIAGVKNSYLSREETGPLDLSFLSFDEYYNRL